MDLPSRVPPHSLEAEMCVLGSVLIDNEAYHQLEGRVRSAMFYKEAHRHIFSAMERLIGSGSPVDTVTVVEELKRSNQLENIGGAAYIVGLTDQVSTSVYVNHYARIVTEKATMRELIEAASKITFLAMSEQGSADELIDQAEKLVFEVANKKTKQGFLPMDQLVKETFVVVDQLAKQQGPLTGVLTGFRDLDSLTTGLHPGSLNILAARPSMGKTACALSIAQNVAIREGQTVAIFSLEMPATQLVLRMLCSEAKVDMNRVRSGDLLPRDFDRLVSAADRLSKAKIFIDDSADLNVIELRSRARRLMAEHGLGLVAIDYLQLMTSSGKANDNRQQEIATISRSLKSLARELDVPVLVLSQLSRQVEARANHRPMLSDLRESGAIEQDSDLVMFIYRDEYYDKQSLKQGIAEIIIGKQRNGPVGTVELQFHSAYVRFNDLAKDH